MRSLARLLVALALVGCNGVSIAPRVDAAPVGDAGPMGDGSTAPDAWELHESPDAGPDAYMAPELEDAGRDAALELPDAYARSDAGTLSTDDACERIRDAYAATTCNPDFFLCPFRPFSGETPVENVEACETAIAIAFSPASGPADMGSMCARAVEAMGRCL